MRAEKWAINGMLMKFVEKKKSCTIEICHKLSFSPCTGRPTLGDHFFFFLELLVYLNYWNDDRIWNELRLSLKRSESRIKLSRPLSVAKKKKGERKKEKEYCPSHQTSSPFKSVLSEIFLLIWQKPNNSQHIHDMSKEQNQWPHWPART